MFHNRKQKYKRRKNNIATSGRVQSLVQNVYHIVAWDESNTPVIIAEHASVSCVWRISNSVFATGDKYTVTPQLSTSNKQKNTGKIKIHFLLNNGSR